MAPKILAVDIGMGTQDVLLYDPEINIENSPRVIVPSATQIIAGRIRRATAQRQPVGLTGDTIGGGPSGSALRRHLAAGLPAYASEEAARTFDDDLEVVQGWGVQILSEAEARETSGELLELRDLDVGAVRRALAFFHVDLGDIIVAAAVQDHGAAPKGVSDRVFRFERLQETLARGWLDAFAYLDAEIPEHFTRMRSLARSLARQGVERSLIMDTGPAAVLGALADQTVARRPHKMVVNAGNGHTLAFHMDGESVIGLFEHHTSRLSGRSLDRFLARLKAGTLTNQEIFDEGGHGCWIKEGRRRTPFTALTGPRRLLFAGDVEGAYLAAPHGDMMLTGCFGLVEACRRRALLESEDSPAGRG